MAKIHMDDWEYDEIFGTEQNKAQRLRQLLQDRMKARPFIDLMLSGHCTQSRAVGQVYSGMGATV